MAHLRRFVPLGLAALTLLLFGLRPWSVSAPAERQPAPAATPPPAPRPSAPPTAAAPSPPPATATPNPPHINIDATARAQTLTFTLRGSIPGGADEALLWYDTLEGHAIRRVTLAPGPTISASVTITPTQEHLAPSESARTQLDYWWAVRAGQSIVARRSGQVQLPALADANTEASAQIGWVERATPHFRLMASPGSAAARDLDRLAEVAEASFAQAAAVISATQPISVPVYLVPRMFWQGGVAYGNGHLTISYLDRNYTGTAISTYFVHEMTHAISTYALPRGSEIGGLLGEGVAVYAAGGHYGPEPIDQWAAVLAASPDYVPLCRLRYDFYAAQHETAYIEGASLAAYLIRSYGLAGFQQIYADQRPQRGKQDTDIDSFCTSDNARSVPVAGQSAAQLEQAWRASLAKLQPSDSQRQTWALLLRFFELMRRYQEQLDPTARDLPPSPDGWDAATAAKFLTAPAGRPAAICENLLGAVQPALRRDDLAQAERLLDAVEQSLDADGQPATPLARDYAALIDLADAQARALRLGDAGALADTLASSDLAAQLPFIANDLLNNLRFSVVRLEVQGDTASALIQVAGQSISGRRVELDLYAAQYQRTAAGWRLESWRPQAPQIDDPTGRASGE